MAKVRVYQLAKELGVQSALILEFLDRIGQDVKSDLSPLTPGVADLVRRKITEAIDTEKKRLADEAQKQEREQPARARVVRKKADQPAAETAEPETAEKADEPAEEPAEQAPAAAATDSAPEAAPAAEEPAATGSDGATDEPAAPQPEPAAPVAAKPSKPAAPTDRPAAVRPSAQRPSTTGSARPETRTGDTPVPPGGRKPRVFPAKRIPPPSMLKRMRPGATTPPAGRTGPPPPGGHTRGAPPPRPRRRKKEKTPEKRQPLAPTKPKVDLPPVPEEIQLSEGVTVKELAEKLNRKSKDVIAKLIPRGVLATINQPLDPEVAIEVALEFGSIATVLSFEEEAQQATGAAADTGPEIEVGEKDTPDQLEMRPPVVTVMGHVDHGKTSLLDAIRTANVVDREAGGITQHIGAYQVETKNRKITFLDTPGHEAFTLMRARGARATDIVVLVVAADDGVKPQTVEAIDHARAAKVPLVVAINKIDKPNSNLDRVKQQLAERELVIEEYGGDVVCCEVSAKQRTGLEELLDMILLVADVGEFKANPDKKASGVVLEARRDRARGVLATVLVQEGTLEVGDPFIVGSAYGKVRAMTDEHGTRVEKAAPSTPVEVMGFADEPMAGDPFQAVADEAKARQIASFRRDKARAEQQAKSSRRTLEMLSKDIAKGEAKELIVLLKADVQGSIEALKKAIEDLPTDKVRATIQRASIGAITQADVLLAAASNAIVVGFNVRPDKAASELAKQEGVEVRMYAVIYDVVDEIKQAMVGLLEPTYREKVLGQAEVRQLFKVPKLGVIAGCYVTDGLIKRNSEVRLIRDNVVIHTGKLGSLRRFKDDASEVKQGYECGIGIANYNDLKEGDVIESFVTEAVAAESL